MTYYNTFSTPGVIELGPLDEKYATRGDAGSPITVLGLLSFTVGTLHGKLELVNFVMLYEHLYFFMSLTCQLPTYLAFLM